MSEELELHHYTIGYCFDRETASILKAAQKHMINKYYGEEKTTVHRVPFFNLPILYLGYLDYKHVQTYMNQVFAPLLRSLSENMYSFPCTFGKIEVVHHGNYEKVYVHINDSYKIIESVLRPYLEKNGLSLVYKTFKKMPLRVELFSIQTNVPIFSSNINYTFKSPSFLFSYLTLVQNTPIKVRPGNPSFLNHAYVSNMKHYRFPLLEKEKESKSNVVNDSI